MTPERFQPPDASNWGPSIRRAMDVDRRLEIARVPRRVLMSADTMGGVWTYAIELARALSEHDVEIAIATMGAPVSPTQWAEVEKLPRTGLFQSTFKLEWMHNPWEDVKAAGEWLLDLEQQLRPDLIHLNGYAHGVLPFRAPKLVVGHSCVLSWWRAVKGEPAPPDWNTYRDAVRHGLRSADHVLAPSRAMLRELQNEYGTLEHADVIYNGRQVNLSQNLRWTAKEPMIFSAGRVWDEAKNIRTLATVARDLPWKVVVAGEATGPDGATLHMDNVQFLGKLGANEVLPWFAQASIYASPAKYEPFGLSIVEAALSRCALVVGDIPSLREIWADAALFVDPKNPEALQTALETFIKDEDMRHEFACRAHGRALELSPANMVAGYLALYSELLRRRHAEPEFICVS
jgi:glycogen(starch) synthase